jgi:pimeloyl-ACP methyl ester carboxylesterase
VTLASSVPTTAGPERLRVPIDIGSGPPVVLLPGYAMPPQIYSRTAELLGRRCRVVIPDLYGVRGRWEYGRVLRAFVATLDGMGIARATLVGHSFGGGIELGYAARYPDRVVELVFADTLAVSREWVLAREALQHPFRLLWLATPRAAAGFATAWIAHPRQLVDAAWWGFTSGRATDIDAIGAAGIPAHVLWANRDSLLSVDDGQVFARLLRASFTVAHSDHGGPVDHDWMYRSPQLFVRHLDDLGLAALSPGAVSRPPSGGPGSSRLPRR